MPRIFDFRPECPSRWTNVRIGWPVGHILTGDIRSALRYLLRGVDEAVLVRPCIVHAFERGAKIKEATINRPAVVTHRLAAPDPPRGAETFCLRRRCRRWTHSCNGRWRRSGGNFRLTQRWSGSNDISTDIQWKRVNCRMYGRRFGDDWL